MNLTHDTRDDNLVRRNDCTVHTQERWLESLQQIKTQYFVYSGKSGSDTIRVSQIHYGKWLADTGCSVMNLKRFSVTNLERLMMDFRNSPWKVGIGATSPVRTGDVRQSHREF